MYLLRVNGEIEGKIITMPDSMIDRLYDERKSTILL